VTELRNSPGIVRWNTDKHYLATLASTGVPVIPSEFAEPGMDAGQAVITFLNKHTPEEFVVKPAVGAGSKDVFRYRLTDQAAAIEHASSLLADQRSILLQPYLDSVDRHGETALLFFAGRFSHAIRKAPILTREQKPVEALFAAERITPRTPGADELEVGEQAIAAIPFEQPLYARVDLIRDATGAPRVLELELTEPSVFLDHSPGSADRFAQAIVTAGIPG
jgi:glutathione synthase/RimK-type ligase-like ATP-grasp enzyme